ncbi:hypothetical protein MMU07_11135 [Aquiflexum sp. LQ15W]|nr:hypothetical protein [Cognataquiflexum nitidum]
MSTILLSLLLVSFSASSQDKIDHLILPVFDNTSERELLFNHQDNPFLLLQSLYPNEKLSLTNWNQVVSDLDRIPKRKRKSIKIPPGIFFLVQQKLLKEYQKNANFSKTIDQGIYDCVTGTAVYALLLNRFDISYQIIETKEHVFIQGIFKKTPFIIESTFADEGMVLGEQETRGFLNSFIIQSSKSANLKPVEVGSFFSKNESNTLFEKIGLRELAGLQYYNDAVKKFDEQKYKAAYVQLLKAEYLYPSERIIDFKGKMEMLLGVVSRTDINY